MTYKMKWCLQTISITNNFNATYFKI